MKVAQDSRLAELPERPRHRHDDNTWNDGQAGADAPLPSRPAGLPGSGQNEAGGNLRRFVGRLGSSVVSRDHSR